MALTASNDLGRPISPLEERTNQTSDLDVISGRKHRDLEATQVSRLSRQQSYRNIAGAHDSSSSILSETDSIYHSTETYPTEKPSSCAETSSLENVPLQTGSQTLPPLAIFNTDEDLNLPLPHSRWPRPQLEPIIERRSRSQLRSYESNPRLRPSPERTTRLVRPQDPARSVHLPDSATRLDSERIGCHHRAFSLNDLDCLPRSDTREAFPNRCRGHSSSSEATTQARQLCLPFPIKPICPPPYRSPTPPGLPSFGTKEAQEYRLGQPSLSHRALLLLRRCFGRSLDKNQLHSSGLLHQHESTIPRSQPVSAPIVILRRMMGVSRIVDSPSINPNPRSTLPPGIRIASGPGPLTRADDGTPVRGRWTNRTSAHGVGQRPPGAHLLPHVAGLHSIDEMVEDIDKACEIADEEYRQRQMSGTRETTGMGQERTERPISEPVFCYQGDNTSMSPASLQISRSSLADDRGLANETWPLHLSHIPQVGGTTLPEAASPTQSLHSHEPYRIYVIPRSSDSSSCQESAVNTPDDVQPGEREGQAQARGHINSQDEARFKFEDCWGSPWLFCCGSSADERRT